MTQHTIVEPNTEEEFAELTPMIERAQFISVTSGEEYSGAMIFMADLRRMEKGVIAKFAAPKTAANKAHKAICTFEKELLTPIKLARGRVDAACSVYEKEQKRLALEEQRIKEAKARKAEEEARLAEAVAAEDEGNTEAAEEIMNEEPVNVIVRATGVDLSAGKDAGVSSITRYSAEVIDLGKLIAWVAKDIDSRGYLLVPNGKALNGMATSMKESFKVPGVNLISNTHRAFR